MILLIQREDIENLIDSQKSAIKLYTFFALGIFLFGICLLVFANTVAQTDIIKTIINIGGAFVSTLSGFPIKEIITRKDKISTYNILKRHVILISEKGNEIEEEEKKKIMDLIMEIMKKNALNV